MAVRRPIERQNVSEDEIDRLISKGALVKEDVKEKKTKKFSNINFRIPTDMLNQVDETLQDRVGISRNGWILEAIQEKLKRNN